MELAETPTEVLILYKIDEIKYYLDDFIERGKIEIVLWKLEFT